jgi:DNA-binding NarL/FixJ family response regulator
MAADFLLQSQSALFATYCLPRGTLVLGRSVNSNVVVGDPSVSRRHARLNVSDRHVSITDLNSANGTFIDGKRIAAKRRVDAGQSLRFGNVIYTLLIQTALSHPESEEETDLADNAPQVVDAQQSSLSKAEDRVCRLLRQEFSEKEIADRLSLSTATVHVHVEAIYRKLKVHSRAEFFVKVFRNSGHF